MGDIMTKTILLAMFVGIPSAYADKVTICEHEGAVREVHVVYEVEGQTVPCSVNYVKETGTQALWRAENNEGYCEEKAADFIAKQESWGWTCESQASAESEADNAISDSEVIDDVEDAAEEVSDEAEDMMESE